MKNLYTERAEQAQEAIDRLRAEMELVTNNGSSRLRWTQHFKEFSAITTLDRRAVIALVQSIRVNAKDDLAITLRYHIEYVKVLKRLDEMNGPHDVSIDFAFESGFERVMEVLGNE